MYLKWLLHVVSCTTCVIHGKEVSEEWLGLKGVGSQESESGSAAATPG